MIAFDFPAVPARLQVRRVRRIAPFVLAAMPAGWLMLLVAGSYQAPLGVAGTLLYLAGFFASFLIIPTGAQMIAGGVERKLDEMQLAARLRAQSEAFRWFSGWILVMAIALELVPPLTGIGIAAAEPALAIFFLWVIAWSIALPAFFLVRTMPESEDGDA